MDKEQLRVVRRQLRESHRKLFDLQGRSIDSLYELLDSIRATQDEMVKLFEADDTLDEATRDDGGA